MTATHSEAVRQVLREAAADNRPYDRRVQAVTARSQRLTELGYHTGASKPLYDCEALVFYGTLRPTKGSRVRFGDGLDLAQARQLGIGAPKALGVVDLPPLRWSDGRGGRHARYLAADHRIALPRWSRQTYIALHEIAHAVTAWTQPPSAKGHGAEFAGIYLELLEIVLGLPVRQELEQAFAKQGKYAQSRPRGRRVVWVERANTGLASEVVSR